MLWNSCLYLVVTNFLEEREDKREVMNDVSFNVYKGGHRTSWGGWWPEWKDCWIKQILFKKDIVNLLKELVNIKSPGVDRICPWYKYLCRATTALNTKAVLFSRTNQFCIIGATFQRRSILDVYTGLGKGMGGPRWKYRLPGEGLQESEYEKHLRILIKKKFIARLDTLWKMLEQFMHY